MNQSGKVALGAMLTALSVVLLIPSALQVLVYALPAIAGMIIMFAVVEMNKGWAFAVYASTSIIGLLFVANKEAIMLYAAFFGYYPILKAILESRCNKVVEYIVKFASFNISMVGAYLIMIYLFGMPYDELMGIDSPMGFYAKYAPLIMLGIGNIVFILFDKGITNIITLYILTWQKKFRKLFKWR